MAIIIVLLAVLLFASSFSFLAIYIEDCAMKKGEEHPLLNDEEFQSLWNLAEGNEEEFERLAAFESKVKQAETEYSLSLSLNPRAHRRMAILFSTWGKEWDREHGVQD